MRAPHLLLVGGGHAAVAVVQRAAAWVRAGARVTLLSDAPHLYYSGMVPEMLGGVYRAEEARIELPRLCGEAGVAWCEGRAVRLDAATRTVELDGGKEVRADLVALNVGSATRGQPEADGRVVLAKPLHRAAALLSNVETERVRRVVVVGGGAAGVEVALNLSARLRSPLSLALVEPANCLLPGFPRRMGARALALLRERGVDVYLGVRADGVEQGAVHLEGGETLPADAVFWAAGPTPPPLLTASSSLPLDGRGYLRVSAALRAPGLPWLFAAGDCAAVEGREGLPRIGVHAVKQGPVLADNLARSLRALRRGSYPSERSLRRFRPYPIAPLILSTGAREGWWTAGPVWLRGTALLRLKHAVDLRWMHRYTSLPRFNTPRGWAHAASASDP